jgi:hypothetical protein
MSEERTASLGPLPRATIVALCSAVLLLVGADARPMTEEDVVRLFVAGRSAEEIVREIERREPAFDLGPDMLDELRNVDLPETIIEAMLRRQEGQQRLEQQRRQATEATKPAEVTGPPALRVALNPGRGDGSRTLGVPARIDPQLAAEWELGNAPDERVFADLALFLLCETPDHVPDHWRLASPLGRDFRSVRRHRLLHFVAGAVGEANAESSGRRARLELPAAVEVLLEPGVAHDLAIGFALQVGGRYVVVAQDRWPGVVVPEAGLDAAARIKGRNLRTLEARFVREDDDEDGDDPTSSPAEADEPLRPAAGKRPSTRRALPW